MKGNKSMEFLKLLFLWVVVLPLLTLIKLIARQK